MAPARIIVHLWALPPTLLGLAFVPESLISGQVRRINGVLEVHGRLARFFLTHCTLLRGGASAMTLGHVVIGRNWTVLEQTRAHERVHVRQYERWGPLFIPAYIALGAIAWLRGQSAYDDNPFEREAFGKTAG